jgi:hypothetical protein
MCDLISSDIVSFFIVILILAVPRLTGGGLTKLNFLIMEDINKEPNVSGLPLSNPEIQGHPIHPKTLSQVRDAALKFKEGNAVWTELCDNLAKSAQLFLAGYGPSEEVLKYSKPEIGFL